MRFLKNFLDFSWKKLFTIKAMENQNIVEIFTDGACKGNPGNGGWGAILKYKNFRKEICGGEANTTNNRMELLAVIKALECLKTTALQIVINTDSKYVANGISNWISNWKKNGWKTSNKQAVKNVDLWQTLDELNQKYSIQWNWVKGHNGNPENERADELANIGITKI